MKSHLALLPGVGWKKVFLEEDIKDAVSKVKSKVCYGLGCTEEESCCENCLNIDKFFRVEEEKERDVIRK